MAALEEGSPLNGHNCLLVIFSSSGCKTKKNKSVSAFTFEAQRTKIKIYINILYKYCVGGGSHTQYFQSIVQPILVDIRPTFSFMNLLFTVQTSALVKEVNGSYTEEKRLDLTVLRHSENSNGSYTTRRVRQPSLLFGSTPDVEVCALCCMLEYLFKDRIQSNPIRQIRRSDPIRVHHYIYRTLQTIKTTFQALVK